MNSPMSLPKWSSTTLLSKASWKPQSISPVHEEFQPRTKWSVSNAFTSAFKEPEPIPQYKATAKLTGFLQAVRPS